MALWAIDAQGNKIKVAGRATNGVASFKGRAGAVTPQVGDYTASQVAFTPPAGMTSNDVQGAVNELFTSVSEGKALIASAVTDKGAATPADASFQAIHDNILDLETGGAGVQVTEAPVTFLGRLTVASGICRQFQNLQGVI